MSKNEIINDNEAGNITEGDNTEGDNTEGDNTEGEEPYVIEEFNDWEEMSLKKDVLRGIYSYGFEKPSPIQKKSYKTYL